MSDDDVDDAVTRADAAALAELGEILQRSRRPQGRVRLPRGLAERAVAAWNRPPRRAASGTASPQRRQAAVFALIGRTIDLRGRQEPEVVVVELEGWQAAEAMWAREAADDSFA